MRFDKSKCRIVKMLLNNRSCVNAIDATSENVIAGLECGAIKVKFEESACSNKRKVRRVCMMTV